MKKLAILGAFLLGACSQLPAKVVDQDTLDRAYEACAVATLAPEGKAKDKALAACKMLNSHGDAVKQAVEDVIAAAESIKDVAEADPATDAGK